MLERALLSISRFKWNLQFDYSSLEGDGDVIGASVLLYPESGCDFLRAMKMSALYAEEVNTLAWVNFEVLDKMLAMTDELNMLKSRLPDHGLAVFKRAFTRTADHMDFLVANKKDFVTLQDEGILRFHDFVDSPDENFSLTEVANQIRTLPAWDKEFDTSFRLLTPFFEECHLP